MKPGDHPDFYRFPAPEGRSRESSIVIDAQGRFWHDGALVEHPQMAEAFARWVRRHPDDGRYILSNGYDWTYIRVEDVPLVVRSVQLQASPPQVELSDGSREPLIPQALREGPGGVLYLRVRDGELDARFSQHAQLSLASALRQLPDGRIGLELGPQVVPLGAGDAGPRAEDA